MMTTQRCWSWNPNQGYRGDMSIMVNYQVFFMSRMMRMMLTMTREKVGVCFSFRSLFKFSVPLNALLKVREE
jgi:hypothetical protein